MDKKELRKAFEEKLGRNYGRYIAKCLEMDASELISAAAEIAAANMLMETLPEAATMEDMEYLLQFDDPLEIVRDGWMLTDDVDHSEEIRYAINAIIDSRSAEQYYALDPEHDSPAQGGQTLC